MLKTRVLIAGREFDVDTIKYAGALWLVPGWRELIGGWRKPARLIRMDTLAYEEIQPGLYRLEAEAPEALFSPEPTEWQKVTGYEVCGAPHALAFPPTSALQ